MPVVHWFDHRRVPDPTDADDNGLVAVGGRLDPEWLLAGYSRGLFPWSSRPILNWWSPDPRAVFPLDRWRPHRSAFKAARLAGWRYSVDEAFDRVVESCAQRAPGRRSTWITSDFIAAYRVLHAQGHAHSVEVWRGDVLVGGLYGVHLGGFFGGESMFHRETGASKAAVIYLIDRLRAGGFLMLDGQAPNAHLLNLGAVLQNRHDFLADLRVAMTMSAHLGSGASSLDPRPGEG